ncbi:phosphoenolpyruvate carboxykinase (ATP) [Sporolactobacillus kofuensis]|uniref:Phosphoenolpyruvate carboxykinase (ATP) n=1 Tax=Sporolactobacillus kofuensis TaxID=269672 RepID=A0ABW1WA16_9BACL|nr:phosphoenolpyruvate carboxykinase (ATP) [Sporolactobacillus kofuensis]MCO7175894.1 phosphoenolpyruvate carboxykinase (ATP) [Sporolactobacillus kofuensis]
MNQLFSETPISELLKVGNTFINLSVPELIEHAVKKNEGVLASNGALCVTTGKYTGRSPKDKFIVKDELTENMIDWSRNQSISDDVFNTLYRKLTNYLCIKKDRYVFRGFAGADPEHSLSIQIINEFAWQNLFCRQLFIEPSKVNLNQYHSPFTVLSVPGFKADPATDGTKSEAFIIISIKHRAVLIGGTEYAGEIKKSIFTVMNYVLPQKGIMPMHCSANQGKDGRVALFFGLSGTGKTTLSNTTDRLLIGDDEHGWSDHGVFNIEGGCYAKTMRLTQAKEPQIYACIQFGSVLENVVLSSADRTPDYTNGSLTENTRVAYSMSTVRNALSSSQGGHPSTIIFLTADAFGVLPPLSILTTEQAMYQFLSGYTSKLAGTERGIIDPEATFSTCFGAPFMPLQATSYAKLLGNFINKYNVNVFMVNTGWIGGPFGVGERIDLSFTRKMIQGALDNCLNECDTVNDPIFGLRIPKSCPGVPNHLLMPWNSWHNQEAYERASKALAHLFIRNFERFSNVPELIRSAGPIKGL